MRHLPIGILAGLVSALLAAPLAVGAVTPLAYFIALPIFFATLCWRHQTGLIAVCVASLALFAGTLNILIPLIVLLCFGLPAWGIAYLFMLGRETASGMEWYPVGRILAWIAGIGAVLTVILLLIMSGGTYQGYEKTIMGLMDMMEPAMKNLLGASYDRQVYVETLSAQFLPSQAIWIIFVLILNLWISAKTAIRLKRISRPRPIISAMRMPPVIVGQALVGLALSFMGGMIGIIGAAIQSAAFTALVLQGLAFTHATSHKVKNRKVFLVLLYVFLVLTTLAGRILPIYVLVCFGAADVLFDIRKKFGADGSAPPPTL